MATDWYRVRAEQARWKAVVEMYEKYKVLLPTLTMEPAINRCKGRMETMEKEFPQLKQK